MSTEKQAIASKFVEAVQTTQYTVPTSKVNKVTNCKASNNGVVTAMLSVHIVPSGGSPSLANRVLYDAIRPNESRNCHELVGEIMYAGGFISATCTSASTITLSCGVLEF